MCGGARAGGQENWKKSGSRLVSKAVSHWPSWSTYASGRPAPDHLLASSSCSLPTSHRGLSRVYLRPPFSSWPLVLAPCWTPLHLAVAAGHSGRSVTPSKSLLNFLCARSHGCLFEFREQRICVCCVYSCTDPNKPTASLVI